MKNRKEDKLEPAIERRLKIKERMAAIHQEKKRLPAVDPARTAAQDAKARLNSLLRQVGTANHGDTTKRKIAKLEALVEQTEANYLSLKQQHKALLAEEEQAAAMLSDIDLQCSISEVIAFQGELAEIEKQKPVLVSAVAEAQSAAEKALDNIPDMAGLLERRENILAEMAIGAKVAPGALESLEEEIAAHRGQIDSAEAAAAQVATGHQETAAGLMRKLASVEARETELREKVLPHGIACILEEKAQAAAVDYCETAKKLVALCREIVGLGVLLKENPAGRDIGAREDLFMFKIPGFDLDACKPFMAARFSEIFTFAPEPGGAKQAASDMRNRIRGAGIEI